MNRRVTSVLLVPAVLLAWLAPAPAAAWSPAGPEEVAPGEVAPGEVAPGGAAEAQPESTDLDEAKHLFDAGATKFETADYAGAIELWTTAFGLVPSEPEYAAIKAKLIANLAEAQKRAYEVDGEAEHLNQAKILLESYQATIDMIYPSAVERQKEADWVDQRLVEIQAELQAIAEREAERARLEDPGPPPKTGKGMRIGGAVLIGLGAGGFGLMAGGLVLGGQNNDISDLPTNDLDARLSRYSQGRAGNAMAIGGGVGGAVLLGVGVALVVAGIARKKFLAQDEGAAASLIFTPTLGWGARAGEPSQLGLGLVGRF